LTLRARQKWKKNPSNNSLLGWGGEWAGNTAEKGGEGINSHKQKPQGTENRKRKKKLSIRRRLGFNKITKELG